MARRSLSRQSRPREALDLLSLICPSYVFVPQAGQLRAHTSLCREVALWRLLRLAFDFKGTRVGRLGCGGTRAGPLDRTGVAVASAIATSGRRPRGAAEDERQEDVAGDATARQVARVAKGGGRTSDARTRGHANIGRPGTLWVQYKQKIQTKRTQQKIEK